MSEKSNNYATPIAIVIAGLFIALAVVYTNGGGGFQGMMEKAPAEPSAYQKYVDIAGDINVDEFEACMAAEDKTDINKDLADAQIYGANGTPAFFIGKSTESGVISAVPVKGAYPYESFQAIIDGLLEGDDQKVLAAVQVDPELGITSLEEVLVDVSVDDDPVKGNENAEITIIEFSDYECPYCQRHFQTTYPQLDTNYISNGIAKYVFRDLPLYFHDPIATEAAIAANCVREQGGDEAYYSFHDAYYENTKTNGEGL